MTRLRSFLRGGSERGLAQLFWPVAGVVVVAILVMSVLVGLAARELNLQAEHEAASRLDVSLAQFQDNVIEDTLEFTWWDESVKRIVILFDEPWASNLWGSYQEGFRSVDIVMVLDTKGEVIMIWQDGFLTLDGEPVDFGPGLDLLRERAHDKSVANPIPVNGWLWHEGELYLVSVGAITPSDPTWASNLGRSRGTGIFARNLQSFLDRSASGELILPDLRVVPVDSPDAMIVLDGPDGQPTAGLSWRQTLPGGALLRSVVIPVGIGLLLIIPFLLAFVARAQNMVRESDLLELRLREEQELNEMKGRFVSMVSHEFRTPLASIMAASEMLTHYGDRLDDKQRFGELVSISNDVDRLTGMLDKVVALQRSDSVLFDLNPSPVQIGQLCQRIIDKALLTTKEARTLVLHGGDEIGVVNIDAQLLEHILSNLITNAIKYSAETSQVHVNLSRVGEDLVIEVIDQGIGIPAKDLENIGTPFYRASNTGSVSGTGLGFAIAARAAARHGGGLEIESELGRGTRVVMRMKISRGGGF